MEMVDLAGVESEYYCFCNIAIVDDSLENGVHRIYGPANSLLERELAARDQGISAPLCPCQSNDVFAPFRFKINIVDSEDTWERKCTPI